MACTTETAICAIQGDDESYRLSFTVNGTTPLNLTGYVLRFILTDSKDDTDAQAIFVKTVNTFTSPTSGVADLTLSSTETDQPLGHYYFKIKLVSNAGKIKTVLRGTFAIGWAK